MSESFLMPSQKKLFNYILHYSSKRDLVEDGVVYTHINSFKTKELVKDTARKFKYIFPDLTFRTTKKRDYKGKIIGYSLYADIMTSYTVPYQICYRDTQFKKNSSTQDGNGCGGCSNFEKCLKIYNSHQEGSN